MRASCLIVYSAYIRKIWADHIPRVVLFMQCWQAKRSITLDVSFTFWPTASIAWFFFSCELMFWFGRYWLWLLANEAVRAEALCQRAELRVQRGHWQERVLGTGIRIVMASCQITVSCVDLCGGASRLSYLTGFPPPEDGTRFVVIIAYYCQKCYAPTKPCIWNRCSMAKA